MPPSAKKLCQNEKSAADGENGILHSGNKGRATEPGEHLIPHAGRRRSGGRADGKLPPRPDSELRQRNIAKAPKTGMQPVAVIGREVRVGAQAAQVRMQPGSVS